MTDKTPYSQAPGIGRTLIYGASDDLIEIAGEHPDELYWYGDGDALLTLDDDVVVRVRYDHEGYWRLSVEGDCDVEWSHIRAPGEETGQRYDVQHATGVSQVPTYSDALLIDCPAVGATIAPAAGPAAAATPHDASGDGQDDLALEDMTDMSLPQGDEFHELTRSVLAMPSHPTLTATADQGAYEYRVMVRFTGSGKVQEARTGESGDWAWAAGVLEEMERLAARRLRSGTPLIDTAWIERRPLTSWEPVGGPSEEQTDD